MWDFDSGRFIEVPVRKGVEDRVEAFLEASSFDAVEPRLAATVMLVRQACDGRRATYRSLHPQKGGNGIEVFMIRRQKTMKFVPDAVVFPGGGVDPRDCDERLPWAGPDPQTWAARLDVDVADARRICVAAVREVFEETGVLLAGFPEGGIVEDLSDPAWAQERADLADHRESFAELLIRRGLILRTDLLSICSNWCTPEFEQRRYNTFFFAARMPEGQQADDRSSEAYIADWVEPQWAFDLSEAGDILLLTPTAYNLDYLQRASDIDALLGDQRPVTRIMSIPDRTADGTLILRTRLP